MESLETVTSIKKISFVFFAILGSAHLLSGSLLSVNLLRPHASLLTRMLFTPFLLASVAYAYGVLKEYLLLNGRKGKVLDYVFLGIGILALFGSLFVEFYFPDSVSE